MAYKMPSARDVHSCNSFARPIIKASPTKTAIHEVETVTCRRRKQPTAEPKLLYERIKGTSSPAEHASESAGVADLLIHDVSHGELRALPSLVEEHAGRLRGRLHLLAGRRDGPSQHAGVRPHEPGVVPLRRGLHRVYTIIQSANSGSIKILILPENVRATLRITSRKKRKKICARARACVSVCV